MSQSHACPNDDTLTLFLDENGSDGSIAIHIRNCAHCQARLESICQDGELETWAKSSNTATPTDGLEYRRVMQRLATIASTNALGDDPTQKFLADDNSHFRKIDHYQIVRIIGSGGMSIVYEAIDLRLNRRVAIKLLRSRDSKELSVARFAREASAIANIHHPNVVTIHQIETESTAEVPYLVMELVDGPSLHAWLNENQTIEPKQAAIWISEIADGLAAAHAAGIIHRDIKPSNILLSPKAIISEGIPNRDSNRNRNSFIAKLADLDCSNRQFGIAINAIRRFDWHTCIRQPEQLVDNATSAQSESTR